MDKKKKEILLEVKDLHIEFGKKRKDKFVAVDGVSFHIYKGETFGLVGESGSGKTTIGRAITRIVETAGGDILFKGQKINGNISKELDKELTRKIQMIFQDPMASLNERAKVDYIVSEGLYNLKNYKDEEDRKRKVEKALLDVGLLPEFASRFPHEFSGGQRQRIGIARSLALRPKLLVCDEPVSALDVSIQSQIINLLMDLQDKYGLTYIFISHDLSVVYHMVDRVAVMYLGRLVELADKEDLYNNPLHPYTKALLQAVPTLDYEHKFEKVILSGDIPSPVNPPSGCVFHTRCPECQEICKHEVPKLLEVVPGRTVACHFAENFIK